MLLVLHVNSAMVASLFSEFLIKQALYKLASSTFAKKDFSPCPCADISHLCGISATAGMAADLQNHQCRKKTLQTKRLHYFTHIISGGQFTVIA